MTEKGVVEPQKPKTWLLRQFETKHLTHCASWRVNQAIIWCRLLCAVWYTKYL